MLKKRKFLIGGIIVALAVGYLIFSSFGSATYFLTVSELLDRKDTIYGQNVRVGGQVVRESVVQESSGMVLKFEVSDGKVTVPVVYQGVVPDTFATSDEVVVEGRFGESGVFQADQLMPKCASKYEPVEPS
ncbi:MAG: cytochrome c maturation protein CcmE [Chloroflexi bacterium]|nr:cytochrome c maturation protein CcmE [Chloroflexota bacterium]